MPVATEPGSERHEERPELALVTESGERCGLSCDAVFDGHMMGTCRLGKFCFDRSGMPFWHVLPQAALVRAIK
jgi:hypothetical protein